MAGALAVRRAAWAAVIIGSGAAFGPACNGRIAGGTGGSIADGTGNADSGTTSSSSGGRPVDRVDLLVVIDNSASMSDKQAYLAQAIPRLIQRLVQPSCVDTNGNPVGPSDAQGLGTCTIGSIEFPPVHDMHVGVLSTSLGTRLSDEYGSGAGTVCDPTATLTTVGGATFPNHNDDRAELLDRTNPIDMSGDPLTDAGSLHYLSWFPAVPKNVGSPAPAIPITSATTLVEDLTSLVYGVGSYGCAVKSQLESWYRFLVQPDPYDSLSLDGSGNAQWVGVDTTILAQRASFLRPDSLVVILDLTDANDAEIDVRSLSGQGYLWMAENFDPFMGNPSCAESSGDTGLVDPSASCENGDCTSSSCTSCAFQGASCALPDTYESVNDWGYDERLRHVHMMQKYGVWPQFPIQRYVLGLSSGTVPDRSGEYPAGASTYQGLVNRDCVNPLFAQSLPDGSSIDAATLCHLTPGPRTPDLVYYAHIGGVSPQLLQSAPGDGLCPAGTAPGDCPPLETLLPSDWTKILGQNPLDFDYSGIDPHMIESYEPRANIPACSSGMDADGVCDWVTNQGAQRVLPVDLEYACTFPLSAPRDCTQTQDPAVAYACDCPSSLGLTPQEIPPVCSPTTPTQQVAVKAYPTERELLLASLMGPQGLVSSLCPIHVMPAAGDTPLTDPLFGYNPAMDGIVDRLKINLAAE